MSESSFRKYRRRISVSELRPFVPGEDLSGISVSDEDQPPREGDMVARNPDNHRDKWLVSQEYFAANFHTEPIDPC